MATKTKTAEAPAEATEAPAVKLEVPEGYAPVSVPKVTRITEANPHLEAVKTLRDSMGEDGAQSEGAVQYKLPALTGDEHKRNRAKFARQLADAGVEHGVTVRKLITEHEDGSATAVFWTVSRISRPRKSKDAESTAAESASK